jgi:dipeptidyl aminopeptidase/acylaminoacyl peptidase
MDADGTDLRRISSGPGADGDPAWTPDGRRLIFTSARSGSSQIYSIAVDGTDLHPLTTAGGGNSAPTVSPDGRTIAFVSGRDGNDEIYRMDVDGGNQTNLSATRERETAPEVSCFGGSRLRCRSAAQWVSGRAGSRRWNPGDHAGHERNPDYRIRRQCRWHPAGDRCRAGDGPAPGPRRVHVQYPVAVRGSAVPGSDALE